MHTRRPFLFRMAIAGAALCAAGGGARANPIFFDGYAFELTPTATGWSNAEVYAESVGGHLASIHSQAEEDFIIDNFLKSSEADGAVPIWIGFYDPASNDGGGAQHAADFIWADGTPIDYTDWNTGEPNNAGNAEYWTAINWRTATGTSGVEGTWNDTPENGSNGYGGNSNGPYYGLIEVPGSNPVPEPGTLSLLAGGLIGSALLHRKRRRR